MEFRRLLRSNDRKTATGGASASGFLLKDEEIVNIRSSKNERQQQRGKQRFGHLALRDGQQ
jgi:hypothetical protein